MDDPTTAPDEATQDSLSQSLPVGLEEPEGAPIPGFANPAGAAGPAFPEDDADPAGPTTRTTTSTGPDPLDPSGPNPWEGDGSERTPLKAPKAWRELIRETVRGAGNAANENVAPGTDLFLTDERDEEIADPLSRIAARRVPDIGKNPDVADAVVAVFILARYVAKQINLFTALRRHARAAGMARPTQAGDVA